MRRLLSFNGTERMIIDADTENSARANQQSSCQQNELDLIGAVNHDHGMEDHQLENLERDTQSPTPHVTDALTFLMLVKSCAQSSLMLAET